MDKSETETLVIDELERTRERETLVVATVTMDLTTTAYHVR